MFEFSGERFNTGLAFIDEALGAVNPAMNAESIHTQDGVELKDEAGFTLLLEHYQITDATPSADNNVIQTEAAGFINFSEIDPFSEGAF